MSDLIFEEPPTGGPRTRSDVHHAMAQELRARPGEWARVSVHQSSSAAGNRAQEIKRGRMSAYRPAGAFEAVSRTVDGEYRVYARYVGEA